MKIKKIFKISCVFSLSFGLLYAKTQYDIDKNVLKKYLPENPYVIDAGAFDGRDTIEICRIWPKARVFAFEPVPVAYDKLKKNIGKNSQVYCYNMALGDTSGDMKMYISEGHSLTASSSLLEPKEHLVVHSNVLFNNVIDVKTVTLDDWADFYHIDHIDFMWLDMQGMELAMLKKSEKIIQTVRLIYLEVSEVELYYGCPLYDEVIHWMSTNGFDLVWQSIKAGYGGNALFYRSL